jgi:hypothetical protein
MMEQRSSERRHVVVVTFTLYVGRSGFNCSQPWLSDGFYALLYFLKANAAILS